MTSSASIEFVQPENAGDDRDTPCPICGEGVGPAPTRCPKCETPHHFDCWEYSGGCGVYGCASKPASRVPAEANTVDLPAKLGLPHKRTGSYAGVWWVPPIAGAASIIFELLLIASLAAGNGTQSAVWACAMLSSLFWIAFSSVHFFVDFEKMRISKAKSFLGNDLLEWGILGLDKISHLEVKRIKGDFNPTNPSTLFKVVAVRKGKWSVEPEVEICPPLRLSEDSMQDVADLFRRIEASGAFSVRLPEEIRALKPPVQNQLLLEAKKNQ